MAAILPARRRETTLSRLTSSTADESAVQMSPPRPNGKPEPVADPTELGSIQQLLGYLLIKHRLITESQLEEALEAQQTMRPHKAIGQLLVERGAMAESDLKAILDLYRKRSRLGETLVKSRVITANSWPAPSTNRSSSASGSVRR